MDPETLIHRIGPLSVENFRLKAHELKVWPVGISVLVGGTPEEASTTMKTAFKKPNIQLLARCVATATLGDIRVTGFDVIMTTSRYLPNHGRIIHPDGASAFTEAALTPLLACFQVWGAAS